MKTPCDCNTSGTTCIACSCDCHRWPLTHTDRQAQMLQQFKAAAQKFVDKVEKGEARSVITYVELKKALNQAKEWGL